MGPGASIVGYLPRTSAQEKRKKSMFSFHPSQEQIKTGKWIFVRTREKDFWGELMLFSCSMWDRGGMWISHVAEDTLIFLPAPSGSEEDQSSPPRLQSRQGRMSRAPRRIKRACKKLLKLKTLAAMIILALMG